MILDNHNSTITNYKTFTRLGHFNRGYGKNERATRQKDE